MKLDIGLAAKLMEVPAAARTAEENGFDALWSAETGHDPFLPLLLAAEHTERIKLGTAIAVAFPRSPLVHAMTAWDLQAASKGRFILGLGTQVKGHNERRFGIPWESPGPKMREMILMIRAAWDCFQNGTRPDFEGEFYRFKLMTPFFKPEPIEHPDIPIYIAGVNEYMCRLAGELCDGFHVHPVNSVKYITEFVQPKVAEGAAKAGRSPDACKLTSSVFVIVGKDAEEQAPSRQLARQQIAFYLSTPPYRPILETHGWGEVGPRLSEKARAGDWGGMSDLVTDEMLDAFAVTGRWDDIADLVKKKYEGLFAHLSFYLPPSHADRPDRWREIARAFND